MKNCFILLVLVLFLSCTKNKKLEGFWYDATRKHNEYPKLLKFQGDKLIDYASVYDTLRYSYFGNRLFLKNTYSEEYSLKFHLKNKTILLINPKNDSILGEFKKKEANYFIKDILNDKSLVFELPSSNGIESWGKYNIEVFETVFFEPLFVAYKKGVLTANFRNKTTVINDDFHKFLVENSKAIHNEGLSVTIQFIADKNLKLKDFEFIKKHLGFASYYKMNLVLDHNQYDCVKGIKKRILEGDINFPPPPIVEEKHTLIIEIGRDSLKIDGSIVNENQLKSRIQKRIVTDSKFKIAYTFADDAVYEDYIKTLEIVYNNIYDLRKTYLQNTYNIDYESLSVHEKLFDYKKEIKEVQKKYPIIFLRFHQYSNVCY